MQIVLKKLLFVRHNRTTNVICVSHTLEPLTLVQVANLVTKVHVEAKPSGTNGSQELLENIQEVDGHFLVFKLNADGVIDRTLWACPCQQANAVKHGSVVIFGTTCNTDE